jgi:hypothetical protein
MVYSQQIRSIPFHIEVNYEQTLTMFYTIHVYVVVSLVKESAENLCRYAECRMIENSKKIKVFRAINLLDNYIFCYIEGDQERFPFTNLLPCNCCVHPVSRRTLYCLSLQLLITPLISSNFSFHRPFLFFIFMYCTYEIY